jgi:hypothetical protein
MQFAKDSFFLALQERLAGLNPSRVVMVSGATVPAVVVLENLPPASGERKPNTFYIEFGAAQLELGGGWNCGLMSLDVAISYYSLGSVASMVDRGRLLAQLDTELLRICQPPNTEKRDYSRSPSIDLGTRVFWSEPTFPVNDAGAGGSASGGKGLATEVERLEGTRVQRRARVKMYFFPEGAQS